MSKKAVAYRAIVGAIGLVITTTSAEAVLTITPGDLMVYQTGTGTGNLSSASTAVFVDEYSPTGTLVQSIAMPTTASGSNNPLTASGSASSEGEITLSADGTELLLTGYAAAPGVSGITSSNSTTTPRTIGEIDYTGNVDTSTTTTAFNGNNIRSVASPDGNTIFAAGANSGIVLLSKGSTNAAGTNVLTGGSTSTLSNFRQLEIIGGSLYVSSSSSTARIGSLGSGLPTGTGAVFTETPGIAAGTNTSSSAVGTEVASPYGYVFTSSTGSGTPDTLYVADNGYSAVTGNSSSLGVIEKFTFNGSSYVADGTISLPGVTGLIGSSSEVGGTPTETLYATTPTGIYDFTDSGLGAFSTTASSLVEFVNNGSNSATENFRGIAFAPVAPVPEPATLSLLGVASLAMLRRRQSR